MSEIIKTKVKGKRLYLYGAVIFMVIALILGGMAMFQFVSMTRQERNLLAISQNLAIVENQANSKVQDKTELERINLENRFKGYTELFEKNSDFAGWISIPSTTIDYPIMSTPESPNYYLRRDFDENYSTYGVPYFGENLNPNETGTLIVYGHNMMTGGLFAPLLKYSDEDFRKEHSKIIIDTLTKRHEYEIIFEFETDANVGSFPYENFTGVPSKDEFDWFMKNAQELSGYEPLSPTEWTDKLLILSTCLYSRQNGRYVVVAKLVSETGIFI